MNEYTLVFAILLLSTIYIKLYHLSFSNIHINLPSYIIFGSGLFFTSYLIPIYSMQMNIDNEQIFNLFSTIPLIWFFIGSIYVSKIIFDSKDKDKIFKLNLIDLVFYVILDLTGKVLFWPIVFLYRNLLFFK